MTGVGCAGPGGGDGSDDSPDGGSELASLGVEQLAAGLSSPDVSWQRQVAVEIGSRPQNDQFAVIERVRETPGYLAGERSLAMAVGAERRGQHRVAAAWYRVPGATEWTAEVRVGRLIRTIEALLAAGEPADALGLAETRLAGGYPPAAEQALAALAARARAAIN